MANTTRSLKFIEGQFFLKHDTPSLDDHWVRVSGDEFYTTNLKAASVFRRYSDENTERVFHRAFNSFYADPQQTSPFSFRKLKEFLDPHQVEGVRWILSRRRSYLAHAPGAGKTATAITASYLTKGIGQTLFIVPPGLTKNWEREILKFTEPWGYWPSVSIIPQSNKQFEMAWGSDFIICPDSMLTREWVQEHLTKIKWKFIAVDEASRFKEPSAERSRAFYGGRNSRNSYVGIFQNSRHVVFMDGSPLLNRPMELWAPVYALSPQSIDCMDLHEFGLRYCGGKYNSDGYTAAWEYKHSTNEQELKEKLQKDFMHVVSEFELSHPERLRSILFTNLDQQGAEVKAWNKKNLEGLSNLSEESSQGELATIRKVLGISKVPWVSSYIKERLKNSTESILLFAWHREVVLDLTKTLSEFNPGVVMGGTTNEVRERFFAEFQQGKRRLIIGNIQATGRGHNLQRADRVVFAEFSWTDELNKQCEKRASRRGRSQASFVRCEYVAVPNSLDEKILNSNFIKQKRFNKIIGE